MIRRYAVEVLGKVREPIMVRECNASVEHGVRHVTVDGVL